MNKCKKCAWSNKIDKEHIFCMFPKCIKENKKVSENDKSTKNI